MAFDLSIFRHKLPSLSEQFRQRVAGERGVGTIRSSVTGKLMMCIFNDCTHHARREHMVAIREGAKPLFFFFCSGRCKKLWLHSHVSLGNRPAGDRGTIT